MIEKKGERKGRKKERKKKGGKVKEKGGKRKGKTGPRRGEEIFAASGPNVTMLSTIMAVYNSKFAVVGNVGHLLTTLALDLSLGDCVY